MFIENMVFLLVPVTAFSLLVVVLVMIFARDKAATLLHQLYVYGVTITALLVSLISVIILLNVLLTNTILPISEQNTSIVYPEKTNYAWETNEYYGYRFEPGVQEYLHTEQDKITARLKDIHNQRDWREQVVTALPLLIAFLPLFLFYRRYLKTTEIASKTTMGLAKVSYLFLGSFLGLTVLMLGITGIVQVGLESYLASSSYNVNEYQVSIDNALRSTVSIDRNTTSPSTLVDRTTAEKVVRKANEALQLNTTLPIAKRNQSLSLGIIFIVVGGGMYFWHRRELSPLLKA